MYCDVGGSLIFLQLLGSFQDLNRSVVKSEYTSVCIPDIELEIPAKSQPGGQSILASGI